MRYELSDCEWSVMMPMLPNKPRRPPRKRPACPQWYLLGLAVGRAVARSAGNLRTLYCYNRFVRWRRAGVWDRIMEALTAAHDAAVQMIDTSVVRVYQHGASIAANREHAWAVREAN